MSIKALQWAWTLPIKATEKIVLLALADASNDDGQCWPGQTKLSVKCGLARETINRTLKRLQEKGFIEAHPQFNQKGQTASNYTLKLGVTALSVCDGGSPSPVTEDHTPCDGESHTPVTEDHTKPNIETKDKPNTPPVSPPGGAPLKKSPDIDGSLIPNLNQDAWNAWLEDRKAQKRKRYRTDRVARQLAELPYQKQAECVQHSIDNTYCGLFPERFKNTARPGYEAGRRLCPADEVRAARQAYERRHGRIIESRATEIVDDMAENERDLRDDMAIDVWE